MSKRKATKNTDDTQKAKKRDTTKEDPCSSAHTCPVCYDTNRILWSYDCGHSFCSICIDRTLSRADKLVCPLCREDIKTSQIVDNIPMRKILEANGITNRTHACEHGVFEDIAKKCACDKKTCIRVLDTFLASVDRQRDEYMIDRSPDKNKKLLESKNMEGLESVLMCNACGGELLVLPFAPSSGRVLMTQRGKTGALCAPCFFDQHQALLTAVSNRHPISLVKDSSNVKKVYDKAFECMELTRPKYLADFLKRFVGEIKCDAIHEPLFKLLIERRIDVMESRKPRGSMMLGSISIGELMHAMQHIAQSQD